MKRKLRLMEKSPLPRASVPTGLLRRWRTDPAAVPPIVHEVLRPPGLPLDAETRGVFEPHFGHDFSHVRVHTDAKAEESARAFNARAYTVGDGVAFGQGQYTPRTESGRRLLAHELTHVVQQSGAPRFQADALGQAENTEESEAKLVAERMAKGEPTLVRQFQPIAVSRAKVQQALEQFLRRVQAAQGGRSLRMSPQVRSILERLVTLPNPNYAGPDGDPQSVIRQIRLNAMLDLALPDHFAAEITRWPLPDHSAEEIARRAASIMPDNCHPDALRILGRLPAEEKPGMVERVTNLVKSTTPAEPHPDVREMQKQRQPTSTEHFEEWAKSQPNAPKEKKMSLNLPVSRLIDIARGLREALSDPKARPKATEALSNEVIEAIGLVDRNSLTPEGADSGNYDDAQEVAAGLARLLDIANSDGQDHVVLQLSDTYNAVLERDPIFEAIHSIALKMRAALPHHAPGVQSVHVMFGNRIVRVISLETTK